MTPKRSERETIRLTLPTVGILLAIVGAGAFAAGQSISTESPSKGHAASAGAAALVNDNRDPTEGTDPPTMETDQLPPGHPPIDINDPGGGVGGATEEAPGAPSVAEENKNEGHVGWKPPARWQSAPNASPMRLATYRVPRAPGDPADGELSVAQAGGSIEANADRWVGQFDPASQKTAKRTVRKVGPLAVTVVQVEGDYSGGMGKDSAPRSGWALLGAIVALPEDSPLFFKLTGPVKTVLAARGEFDALVGSLTVK